MQISYSLSYPLEYFIGRTKFKLHVSFVMTSRREACSSYISTRILYWDDDVHMFYKGVYLHDRINWVKWTHGHFLVLFLIIVAFE